MEFRGIYENGVIRPTEPVNLPEGTEVEFQAAGNGAPKPKLKNWESKSLEELAREQGVGPITDFSVFQGVWPEDESVDEFVAARREWRNE